jgi:translation initiation factor IF-1
MPAGNMSGVTLLVRQTPVTLAIATSVAGKAAEALTEQGRQAIAAITGKIRDRLRSRSGDVAVLDAAAADPSVAGPLASVLDREFTADPQFREEIEALWRKVSQVNTVTNVNYGTAQTLIQARDLGNLTIN